MANSRRVYITLNQNKDKDRVIEDFLSNSYSEADCIKEVLYRMATENPVAKKSSKETNTNKKKVVNVDSKVKQLKTDLTKIAMEMVLNA
ncbi:hypothetical protein [Clostridium beijerinckii]|uniref:hypothetical protein n=1 Tax=Clostridium beijerinckii TaxID=1520 RepID=UPI00156D959A|nr:hypothetical protein [Clostridium beijerinckii]NRU52485.1 hypothetical protein [Clostridium beijerinckii]NYC69070.1 hypothetical protein [Clostridium beijerinckii]NYC91686.1 hypothetical protein [Clostridium beijerinckii]